MMRRSTYESRKYTISIIFIVIGLIFIARLFYLQIIDDSYKASAANNSRRDITIYPARGLIYDRYGELLVYNEAIYDLMVIPRQVKEPDTLDLCQILGITIEDFRERFAKAKSYSRFRPSFFDKQLSKSTAALFQEKIFKFKGFYLQERTYRKYPKPIAAHTLGYIGEVDQNIIANDPYYKSGDYIGRSGLEKSYEKYLRGKRGIKAVYVDRYGREKGSFLDGKLDEQAIAGQDVTSTLSIELQEYAEKLMQNKRGSVVAIEPATGEILTLVSVPGYDPNLLVGRDMPKNYLKLQDDPQKPLFNRALMAKYPPGSIFKIVQALVGLDMKVIDANTGFACNKSLVGCHNHPSPSDVPKAIQYSCNPYFYQVYKRIIQQGKEKSIYKDSRIGLKEWREEVLKFGMGKKLQIDLPASLSGTVPSVEFYDKWYGKERWAFSTIYSNSIGQGEVEVIPLQMANLAATIANRGYFITPHLVKSIGDGIKPDSIYHVKNYTGIDQTYFELAVDAMYAVVNIEGGTARRARIDSIEVCGKTGTAENPHGEDHSVFIAFAPRQNPKIAIAVYVENSGFGGTWAAPIASLLIEKYLTGKIKNSFKEQRIFEANFLKE